MFELSIYIVFKNSLSVLSLDDKNVPMIHENIAKTMKREV